ncbi:hypothetical protein KFE25_008121 [Diacronema lutheri]|uniref:Uncharacterized protein n=1 Tax=Diacronema lutheri TaxID=2081491 RepID=A0A8J5XQV8_DIALT|nr:hypothetical protein KFE25_008121 [Diacronema lutheri]
MARVLKAPEIKLAVDLTTTRVASRLMLLKSVVRMERPLATHMLLNSVVRMERPLATHMSQFDQVKDTCPQLTDVQWQTAREFEAVLNQTKHLTTLAQKEKMFVGPYVPLVLLKLEAALKSNQLAIIKRDKLPAVSLDPAPLAALLDELHAPLRRSGAVVLDNQRVLQHNICSVEALAIRVAHGARKQRKGLGECRAHIEGVAHLEVALVESRARLASALDATERLRRMLPADVRPAPFDPEATTVFGTPPGARPDQILEAVGLALPVPIGASLLRALGAPAGVVTASALAPPSDSSDGDEGLSETDC